MIKKGDTLIEVTLAIGIFSLVAIAVVSVVNGSTSGAQSSLETTLTREEIDIQAEALRFIQSSYINSNTANEATISGDQKFRYKELWQKVISQALQPEDIDLKYQPRTCQELYNIEPGTTTNKIQTEQAFVINTRQLGTGTVDDIVVFASKQPNLFSATMTYPRIVYGLSEEDEQNLATADPSSILYKVEGLYVTAVEGPRTNIVTESGTIENKTTSAYYDFYIRSCWYGPGASTPSAISTVMRLYNPDVVKLNPKKD